MNHVYSTLAVFVLALIAAHLPVAWVVLRRRRRILDRDRWSLRWEASDYASVGLAVFALIPAALEVRKYYQTRHLDETLTGIEYKRARWGLNPLINARSVKGEDDAPEKRDYGLAMVRHLDFCNDIVEYGRDLARSGRFRDAERELRTALRWMPVPVAAKPPAEPVPEADRQFFAKIEEAKALQRDHTERLAAACADLQRHEINTYSLLAAPYLLSLSLAIRLAKVSAKVLLEYQKRLPPLDTNTINAAPAVSPPARATPDAPALPAEGANERESTHTPPAPST